MKMRTKTLGVSHSPGAWCKVLDVLFKKDQGSMPGKVERKQHFSVGECNLSFHRTGLLDLGAEYLPRRPKHLISKQINQRANRSHYTKIFHVVKEHRVPLGSIFSSAYLQIIKYLTEGKSKS